MDNNISSWRSQAKRQRIVDKINDTLERFMPQTGPDGMAELNKIAVRFEDKVYTNSANQTDYLRKIALKMISLESKASAPLGNYFPGSYSGNNHWRVDPAVGGEGREEVYGEQSELVQPLDDQSQGDIGMVVDGPPPQTVPVETIQRALRVLFFSYLPRDAPDPLVVDDLAELEVPDAALAPALQVLETLRHQQRRIVELEEELRGLRALC